MTITALQAAVTKVAADVAFNGTSTAVSSFTGDWQIVLLVHSLTAGKKARLVLADSVDAFTAEVPGIVQHLSGEIKTAAPQRFTFTKRDFPHLRIGTASAVVRWELVGLDASGSIKFESWLES